MYSERIIISTESLLFNDIAIYIETCSCIHSVYKRQAANGAAAVESDDGTHCAPIGRQRSDSALVQRCAAAGICYQRYDGSNRMAFALALRARSPRNFLAKHFRLNGTVTGARAVIVPHWALCVCACVFWPKALHLLCSKRYFVHCIYREQKICGVQTSSKIGHTFTLHRNCFCSGSVSGLAF